MLLPLLPHIWEVSSYLDGAFNNYYIILLKRDLLCVAYQCRLNLSVLVFLAPGTPVLSFFLQDSGFIIVPVVKPIDVVGVYRMRLCSSGRM